MKILVEMLTEQTQSLKTQYIDRTVEWANLEYDRCLKMVKWEESDWCKYLGIEPAVKKVTDYKTGQRVDRLGFPKGFWNRKESKTYDTQLNRVRSVLKIGRESYISKEKKFAELHYESSISKLADRIQKKDLNHSNLEVTTSHIGPNIDTVITDGNKTVRAFTIIASGDVQRPHYRYLVK